MDAVRIDKWLWAARFFKTRSIAQDALSLGRVLLDGQRLKASREVKVGDCLRITRGDETLEVIVKALSSVRGPASEAQKLYDETLESLQKRERLKQNRLYAPEPSLTIEKGRPTKRQGRQLRALQSWQDE